MQICRSEANDLSDFKNVWCDVLDNFEWKYNAATHKYMTIVVVLKGRLLRDEDEIKVTIN